MISVRLEPNRLPSAISLLALKMASNLSSIGSSLILQLPLSKGRKGWPLSPIARRLEPWRTSASPRNSARSSAEKSLAIPVSRPLLTSNYAAITPCSLIIWSATCSLSRRRFLSAATAGRGTCEETHDPFLKLGTGYVRHQTGSLAQGAKLLPSRQPSPVKPGIQAQMHRRPNFL